MLKFWGSLEYIASKLESIGQFFQGSILFYPCHSELQIIKVELRVPTKCLLKKLFIDFKALLTSLEFHFIGLTLSV